MRLGESVVICEQVGDPADQRVRWNQRSSESSPGTLTEEAYLDAGQDQPTGGRAGLKTHFGVAALDLSTGRFNVQELDGLDALVASWHDCVPLNCCAVKIFRSALRWKITRTTPHATLVF